MERMKRVRWQVWLVTNYGQPIFHTTSETRKAAIEKYGKAEFEAGFSVGRLKVEKFMLDRRPEK